MRRSARRRGRLEVGLFVLPIEVGNARPVLIALQQVEWKSSDT